MSPDSPIVARADELLQLFSKGAEFTRELLEENERLRYRILELERLAADRPRTAERETDENRRLLERIRILERERQEMLASLSRIEERSREHEERYADVERENRNLARLYAAAHELHSTLDFDEVLRLVSEVIKGILLVDSFVLYMADDERQMLVPLLVEGDRMGGIPIGKGEGLTGITFLSGEPFFSDRTEATDASEPIATAPLTIRGSTIGVISLFRLAPGRPGFAAPDRQMFILIAQQVATALFASRLYMNSTRKLNTIKGFLDVLKNRE